jgi:hypothetical protein
METDPSLVEGENNNVGRNGHIRSLGDGKPAGEADDDEDEDEGDDDDEESPAEPESVALAGRAPQADDQNDAPPSLVLGAIGEPVLVCGKEKPAPSLAAWKILHTLISNGPGGLSLSKLSAMSQVTSPNKILDNACGEDRDWRRAVVFPKGARGIGYRVINGTLKNPSTPTNIATADSTNAQ